MIQPSRQFKDYVLSDAGAGRIAAHRAGESVGVLMFHDFKPDMDTGVPSGLGGTIRNVWVKEGHRRRGLATAMLAHARGLYPEHYIRHSELLTGEGKSWAQANP